MHHPKKQLNLRLKTALSYIFIHSQLWVGLAATALSFLSLREWDLPMQAWEIPAGIGFLSWSAYAYIRLMGKSEGIHHQIYRKMPNVFRIILVTALPLGIYILIHASGHWSVPVVLGIPPAILVLMYPLRFRKNIFFREMVGIKMSFIVFCWVWITVSIPSLLVRPELSVDLLATHLQRLIFLIAWTLPFDIRDMNSDHKGMQTIPQQSGINNAKQFIYGLIFFLQLTFLFTGYMGYTSFPLVVAYIAGLEYLQWLVVQAQPERDNGRYSFWIEGTPVVILLLFLFVESIFAS